MTNDEITAKLKKICEIKKQIRDLQQQRYTEEVDIAVQYKVDECNQARAASAERYKTQINDLSAQIVTLEDELGCVSEG